MELCEAAYITCMLIVYVIRRTGSISFEEKVKILQYISDLVLSLDMLLKTHYAITAFFILFANISILFLANFLTKRLL